jgi:hypothetical protein
MIDIQRQTRMRMIVDQSIDVINADFTRVIIVMDREDLDSILLQLEAKEKYFDSSDMEAAREEAYKKGRKDMQDEIRKALGGVLPLH